MFEPKFAYVTWKKNVFWLRFFKQWNAEMDDVCADLSKSDSDNALERHETLIKFSKTCVFNSLSSLNLYFAHVSL